MLIVLFSSNNLVFRLKCYAHSVDHVECINLECYCDTSAILCNA